MPRRIDIELTSARPDGAWTWRAAGALKPRGVLDGALLYEGAKAGDVVRADAEFEIDGIAIVGVLPPKEDKRPEPERIEVLGPARTAPPGVTTQLVGRGERRPGDRRRERDGGRPPRDRQRERERREQGPEGARPAGGSRRAAGPEGGDATRRPRGEGRPGGDRRGEPRPGHREPHRPEDARARSRRLTPASTHRQAALAALPPEQQPVAEQLLRGGIPAVRTALHLERERAAAEGRPAPNSDELIALAEQLLPRLRAAEWRDRAEAAAKAPETITLRDLRSVVAGADIARDDETRALAATLREALEQRVTALHAGWTQEIGRHLDEHRVVRALRLAARPPEPAARLDAASSTRLSEAAGAALAADAPGERWLAVLEAVAASPVARAVKPAALPEGASAELRRTAAQYAGRVPALAGLLGIAIPPPPGPVGGRGPRRPGTGEGRRPARRASRPSPAAPSAEPASGAEDAPQAARPEPEAPMTEAAPEAPPTVSPEPGAQESEAPSAGSAPGA